MRDLDDTGGISEADARRLDRVSADAFFLVRAMVDDQRITLSHASMESQTLGPIATPMLYRMWLSMGRYIGVTADYNDEFEGRIARTIAAFLNHLKLDPEAFQTTLSLDEITGRARSLESAPLPESRDPQADAPPTVPEG